MPTYTWYSPELDEYVELQSSIDARDVPPELEGEATWERVMEMPSHLRKTFLDGQRKDLADFKKIAKLKVKEASLRKDSPERVEIAKEVADRKKIRGGT